MGIRARAVQCEPDPSNAGTEHLRFFQKNCFKTNFIFHAIISSKKIFCIFEFNSFSMEWLPYAQVKFSPVLPHTIEH
ncbi:hypothetical protein XHV734_0847 [Xanthomonas hortorum pv. vitians]|nr:hypothetical protein XHV734_0847 [Xanthomonas hortorum pv. vitians]